MIYATNEAKQKLDKLLAASDHVSGDYLRLIDDGEGMFRLTSDTMKPGDEKLEYHGKVLVVADPGLSSDYRNILLDAYRTLEGDRLVISNEDINQSSRKVTVNWVALPQN